MYTREISEIFHIGWPDPDWIKGFSVAITPYVKIDPLKIQEVMTTEEISGIEPLLARNNFDSTHLTRIGDASRLTVVRGDRFHCGMLNSPMHGYALASLNFRLDTLLNES